jgi:hypothetical protein
MLKRSISAPACTVDDSDDDTSGGPNAALQRQKIRGLGAELARLKRSRQEVDCELFKLKRQNHSMGAICAAADKAWNQLYYDIESLIGQFPDLQQGIEVDGHISSNVMSNGSFAAFLSAGDKHLLLNPSLEESADSGITCDDLDLDDWSPPDEIQAEKERLMNIINNEREKNSKNDDNDDGVVDEYDANFDAKLQSRIKQTMSLVSRLCTAIVANSGKLEGNALVAIADKREVEAERNALVQRVTRLRHDLLSTSIRLFTSEQARRKHERVLDRIKLGGSVTSSSSIKIESNLKGVPLQRVHSAPVGGLGPPLPSSAVGSSSSGASSNAVASSGANDEVDQQSLHGAEDFASKVVELESQVADLKEKLATAVNRTTEVIASSSQGKVKWEALEAAVTKTLATVESSTNSLLSDAEKKREEALERLKRAEDANRTLEDRISQRFGELEKKATEEVQRVKSELDKARTELQRLEANKLDPDHESNLSIRLQSAIELEAQSRAREETLKIKIRNMEAGYTDVDTQVSDLIAELGEISASEEKARAESTKLQNAMQGMNDMVKNLRSQLHGQTTGLLESKKQMAKNIERLDLASQHIQAQTAVVNQLKRIDRGRAEEAIGLRKQIEKLEKDLRDQKAALIKSQTQATDRRVALDKAHATVDGLKTRCKELALETGNDPSSKKRKIADGDSGSAQLDMCMSLLRCSICNDRFKSVVITRCYHMFCAECTDNNLKSRHRKCPACGERFGQDDVQKIFFGQGE